MRAIIRYDPDMPQEKEMVEATWGTDHAGRSPFEACHKGDYLGAERCNLRSPRSPQTRNRTKVSRFDFIVWKTRHRRVTWPPPRQTR